MLVNASWCLLCAWHCVKVFTCISHLIFATSLWKRDAVSVFVLQGGLGEEKASQPSSSRAPASLRLHQGLFDLPLWRLCKGVVRRTDGLQVQGWLAPSACSCHLYGHKTCPHLTRYQMQNLFLVTEDRLGAAYEILTNRVGCLLGQVYLCGGPGTRGSAVTPTALLRTALMKRDHCSTFFQANPTESSRPGLTLY